MILLSEGFYCSRRTLVLVYLENNFPTRILFFSVYRVYCFWTSCFCPDLNCFYKHKEWGQNSFYLTCRICLFFPLHLSATSEWLQSGIREILRSWPEFSCDEDVLVSWVVLVLTCPSMNESKEWLRVVGRAKKSSRGDSFGANAVKASKVGKPDLWLYQNPDLVLWCWGQPPSASSPCCPLFQLIEPQTLALGSFNMPKVGI